MQTHKDVADLYAAFEAPIAAFDCGEKCAPFNHGVPVCCDSCQAVPTAYPAEWDYLQANTDLWHKWESENPAHAARLQGDAGENLILIECLGHEQCQREFRSLVCRAFPFFPYFSSAGDLLGMSVYWEYEQRCWVISNLQIVRNDFREQFMQAHEKLFELMPQEREAYRFHSAEMRRVFRKRGRKVPLLHRNGYTCLIDPESERLHTVSAETLPKHGPFEISDRLPFPDELQPAEDARQ